MRGGGGRIEEGGWLVQLVDTVKVVLTRSSIRDRRVRLKVSLLVSFHV